MNTSDSALTFTNAARRNKFLPPTSDQFDIGQWEWEFKQRYRGDPQDLNIYMAGQWISDHIKRVEFSRSSYRLGNGEKLSALDIIRAHIAISNYSFFKLASTSDLLNKADEAAKSGEVIEHILDSIRGPVYELLQKKNAVQSEQRTGSNAEEIDRFEFVRRECQMAQLKEGLLSLWQQFLWGNAIFTQDPHRDLVFIANDGEHKLQALAAHRRAHHATEVAGNLASDLHEVDPQLFEAVARKSRYLIPNTAHSIDTMLVANWEELSEGVRKRALYDVCAPHYFKDEHLRTLIETERKELGGISIKTVQSVWTILAVFARQLYDEMEMSSYPNDWDPLVKLCPVYNVSLIKDKLIEVTGFTEQALDSVLKLLTYSAKSRRDDIWIQPLIAIDDCVMLSLPSILAANLYRNVEEWLRISNLSKEGERGKLLEFELIPLLKECTRENAILSSAITWTTPSLHYYGDVGFEDIDLSFCIENLIVIVEARSRRRPHTPLDYHNDMHDKNGLLHKVDQASRKANYVNRNLGAFCRDHYPALVTKLSSVKILPVVISDGHYHVGTPLSGVGIVDIYALQHFLRDGKARFLGTVGSSHDHKYEVLWYESASEAAAIFPNYIQAPTVVRITEQFMRKEEKKNPPLGPGVRPISFIQWVHCEPTEERLLKELEQVPVGWMVKRAG